MIAIAGAEYEYESGLLFGVRDERLYSFRIFLCYSIRPRDDQFSTGPYILRSHALKNHI